MSVIEFSVVEKTFGKKKALDGLDAAFNEGRITGLIGRNGAGKTTLLKLAAGYWKPTAGSVKVFGQNPFNSLDVSSKLIFVDENMAFPSTFSLQEILNELPRFYKNFDLELAKRLAEYHSLDLKQRHTKLSKGLKSTFNSIAGLAAHCPLTLFDEPTTGMDVAARKDFYRALLKDYLAFPRTIVLSSHLVSEVDSLLEEIVLIDDGRQSLHMTADEAREYAITLCGSTENIEKAAKEKTVLHREESAGGICLTIKNELSEQEKSTLAELDIKTTPVTPDNLFVYLTEKEAKGGIDNVFTKQ